MTTIDLEIPRTLNKVIFKLDSQILSSMNLCPNLYNQSHVMNRRVGTKATPLARGDSMHRMLAHYYRSKLEGRYHGRENVVISEAIQLGRDASIELGLDPLKFEEEDLPTFKGYVLKWQYDGWEVQFVEQPFSTVLYDADDLKVIWEGVIDLGIIDPKGMEAVVDHKTESRRSHPLLLSDQFEGYSYSTRRPIIVNKVGYQSTLPDEIKYRRYHFTYSDALIKEWREDAIRKIREAINWHKEGYFAKNRTACGRYFEECDYHKVCSAEPEVREHKLRAYFNLEKPWDPYTRDSE